MVRVEGAVVGWQRTAETDGCRRDWPLTHSSLSRTGEDLREADAIDEEEEEAEKSYLCCSFTNGL